MAALKASFRGELSAVSFLDSSRGPFVQHKGWMDLFLFRCLPFPPIGVWAYLLAFPAWWCTRLCPSRVFWPVWCFLTPFLSILFHISGFHSNRFAMCVAVRIFMCRSATTRRSLCCPVVHRSSHLAAMPRLPLWETLLVWLGPVSV